VREREREGEGGGEGGERKQEIYETDVSRDCFNSLATCNLTELRSISCPRARLSRHRN